MVGEQLVSILNTTEMWSEYPEMGSSYFIIGI